MKTHFVNKIGVAAVLLVASCGAGDQQNQTETQYGPLAVYDDNSTGTELTLGGTGTLRIDQNCVWLDTNDREPVPLAWRSSNVEWSNTNQTITFTDQQNETTITHGDQITIGGTNTPTGLKWLTPPNTNCKPEPFLIHAITPTN